MGAQAKKVETTHMAATMYRVSCSTEDIQCIVLHRSTGPGGFSPGSLYVVGIYRPGIHCIVLDRSTGPAGGHRLRFRNSGSSTGARSGGCVCFTVNTNSGGLNGFYISVDSGKVCGKRDPRCVRRAQCPMPECQHGHGHI